VKIYNYPPGPDKLCLLFPDSWFFRAGLFNSEHAWRWIAHSAEWLDTLAVWEHPSNISELKIPWYGTAPNRATAVALCALRGFSEVYIWNESERQNGNIEVED